ncbi:MAG: ligase-associated DNA damage response DEXH box helicase [Planctomycetes bacterium]|nr:ligase-associated DNA damage response DEXH box helicase [Planctomycetota bacterium]
MRELDLLAAIERWFADRNWTPWEFQRQSWRAFLEGRDGLIQVPTGAGKTYAAYFGALALLRHELSQGPAPGLRILYITPLRAVSRDIELALRAPAADLCPSALVETRTGDTKASIRAKQRDRLPHILITTPESLTLLLTRPNAADLLGGVRAVIADEWHELLSSKRGSQTELALARLRRFAPTVRTWALSATIANAQEAAYAAAGVGRDPVIIRAPMQREVIIDSVIPADLRRLPLAGHLGMSMLPDVISAIDPDVSTLVFTNTRSQAERWFHAIAMTMPQWADRMALHHGSIDRDEREAVEAGLKNGALRIVVATSSLDLGVDFSPVERVFQIGSVKGVSRLVQRAGRASHRPFQPCRITCVPTHGLELFEIDAVRRAVAAGHMEPRDSFNKPLDVLAQHLVTCGLGGGFDADDLFEEVRTAWSFRSLTREEFDWAISLVREGGGTLAAYPEYHRIAPVSPGTHRYHVPSARIAQLHRLNVGTITGDGTLDIRYLSGRSLGRIEEGFIAGLRAGQKFVFAGKVVSFVMLKDLVAYVKPAKGNTSYTPIWGGTKLPISESLAAAIRCALERSASGIADSPELAAASSIIAIQQRLSRIPRSDELLIETSSSREGRHLFIFPFEGRLVHAGLASIIALRLSQSRKATFAMAVNDYGLELACTDPFPFEEFLGPRLFSPDDLDAQAQESINMTELAKLQFRDVARVSGLVFQNYPGAQKTARQSQAGAGLIFDVLREFDPGNLLLRQAEREVMDRHFEQSRLFRTMERLASSRLTHVDTQRFTPLSFPLVIERQAGRLSSETILERVEKMCLEWGLE